jgi:hypothetical protein
MAYMMVMQEGATSCGAVVLGRAGEACNEGHCHLTNEKRPALQPAYKMTGAVLLPCLLTGRPTVDLDVLLIDEGGRRWATKGAHQIT